MRVLHKGINGVDVRHWQTFLIGQGVLPPGADDGRFGPVTHEATRTYQAARGLDPDGRVGRRTLAQARLDGFIAAAPPGDGNFYTDVIRSDPRFNSTARISDLQLLEPVLRRKVQAIVAVAQAHGVRLEVYETYRSQARQTQLFNQGRHSSSRSAPTTTVSHAMLLRKSVASGRGRATSRCSGDWPANINSSGVAIGRDSPTTFTFSAARWRARPYCSAGNGIPVIATIPIRIELRLEATWVNAGAGQPGLHTRRHRRTSTKEGCHGHRFQPRIHRPDHW